jgi:hypothetical protein
VLAVVGVLAVLELAVLELVQPGHLQLLLRAG